WGLAALGSPNGPTRAYAYGGALIVTAGVVALVAAVSTRKSVVTRTLAARPLAYLGRLSYGIYLWHWPLWVWTQRQGWWDLTVLGPWLHAFVLTLATVALAAASYRFVESPIRYGRVGRFLVPRRTLIGLAAVLTSLFVVDQAVVVPYAGAALGRT